MFGYFLWFMACSETEKQDVDNDGDGILAQDDCDDSDASIGTGSEFFIDADGDGFTNAEDQCRSTPAGEQVDENGCSDTQKDDDGDNVNNARDMCPNTVEGRMVDIDGCSSHQLDTDEDGVYDVDDECPNTVANVVVLETGCSLSQMDSDGDLVSDAEDDFPYDANETTDTDGDGVADRWDKFPQDAERFKSSAESGDNTGLYIILALVVLGILGALGFTNMRKQQPTVESAFTQNPAQIDEVAEAHFSDKSENNPLDGAQQWVDNGIHWNKDAQGNLSYFDAEQGAWVPYQQ